MKRTILLFSILLIFTGQKILAQLPDFCLTKDEYRLYSLVNEYRTKKGLSIIPVSKSLCYVAKVHARDLFMNNPDTAHCSLNSWSDKGQWTACCNSKFTPSPACIVNKPRELTKYTGEGHEIAYWDSELANPDTVLGFWQSYEQTREMILNEKKWSYFTWKALGVGIYKGYACLWVGEAIDAEPEPTLCASTPGSDNLPMPFKSIINENVTKPTGRYYIIFGSFITVEDAGKMVEKCRKEGFVSAKILEIDQKTFRVSLNDFATQQDAINTRQKLGSDYKDAWITKF
jgi:hypothetical protein